MITDREFCLGCQRFVQKDDYMLKEDKCYRCVQHDEFRKQMEAKKKREASLKVTV